MIRAVLLDIDNTILDFDAYVKESMRSGFEKFGLGTYDDDMFPVFKKINTGLWEDIERGALSYEGLLQCRWNKIFAALNISFDGQVFEKHFKGCLFDSAIPMDGAFACLDYLKEKYILAVASNGPYEQQVNRLQKGGMLPYFSKLFISSAIGASKPSEKFFSHCLNELNDEMKKRNEHEILPAEIMMIGDSLTSDIAGALDSGMKACYVDRYMSGRTNNLPIDYVITGLDELKAFL